MKTFTYREFAFSADYPFNVINALKKDINFSCSGIISESKINWMIDNLPIKESSFFHQCFEEKKSFEELSKQYDTSDQNIRAWYHRGLFFLSRQWDIIVNGKSHGYDLSVLDGNGKYLEHINTLNCSRKIYSALIKAGIITVGDVVAILKTDPSYIINLRLFGFRCYEELLKKLDRYFGTKFYYQDTYSLKTLRENLHET